MRLAILTTDTLHHTYFVREVAKRWPVELCLLETRKSLASYPTDHAFEKLRDDYERQAWGESAFGASPVICWDANDSEAVQILKDARSDVAVVFGTGKIGPGVVASCRHILNLHGGDPQRFRGLDSHLWSILCDEFPPFAVTLHRLTPALDAGDIVGTEAVYVRKGMRLHEVRRFVTEACVRLVNAALEEFAETGRFSSRPQEDVGVYCHAMPAWLKERAVKKFEAYTGAM